MSELHQSQLAPEANKFHVGNGDDGKHYWLTPPYLYNQLNAEFKFDFDPCPFPKPAEFDGLTADWGKSSYVNPPFGSIMHMGKKKGPTAWARKAIAEQQKGNRVVLVYPIDKWVLMLLAAGAKVRNLGDVRWHTTEDGSTGKGTGRHIACFVLEPAAASPALAPEVAPGHVRFDLPAEACMPVSINSEYPLYRCMDCAVQDYGPARIVHKPGCRVAAALAQEQSHE